MSKNLYTSKGNYIATLRNGHLFAPNGKNIGHYLEDREIFIDMKGNYLGEIYNDTRLVYRKNSGYSNTKFGIHGNAGNIGNQGNPGRIGPIALPAGIRDVEIRLS